MSVSSGAATGKPLSETAERPRGEETSAGESAGAGAATLTGQAAEALVVTPPAAGEVQVVVPQAGATYLLNFAPQEVFLRGEGADLMLVFGDGGEGAGRIVFQNLAELAAGEDAPSFQIGGIEVSAALLMEQAELLAGGEDAPAETAVEGEGAPGGGASTYSDNLGDALELLAAQGVIDPTQLQFGLIATENFTGSESFLAATEEGAPEVGILVINEIGLGAATTGLPAPIEGDGPARNYVELFNDSSFAFTTEGHAVQFLNPDGDVVTQLLPDGLVVPPGGFLVIYQTAGEADPNALLNVAAVVFDAGGALAGSIVLLDQANWNLGENTSEPLAVNLVAGLGTLQEEGLDTFAANLTFADLAVLASPTWGEVPVEFQPLFETFNGLSTTLQNIFSRVFTDGDPASGAPLDSDSAADWTANHSATDGALNDVENIVAPGPEDPNASDPQHDDTDPQQANAEALAGQSVLFGGDGDDLLEGFGGPDFLFGGAGNDSLYGGSQAEVAAQAAILNELPGGTPDEGFSDHNDVIDGGLGNDAIFGGAGLDVLYGGDGADSIDGGTGGDTLYGGDDGGMTPDGDDVLAGDGLNNVVNAPVAAFALTNLGGEDSISGGAGNDMIGGEAVAHSQTGFVQSLARNDDQAAGFDPNGNDTLEGGTGADRIAGEALAYSTTQNAGAAVFNGGDFGGTVGMDSIIGGDDEDVLAGEALAFAEGAEGSAEVTLEASDGTVAGDSIRGGAGEDAIAGEAIAVGETAALAHVEISAVGAEALAGNDTLRGQGGFDRAAGEALALSSGEVAVETGILATGQGIAGSDFITGNSGTDWLAGELLGYSGEESVIAAVQNHGDDATAGSDELLGGGGDDYLAGEAMVVGNSDSQVMVINEGSGNAIVGSDSIRGGNGDDVLAGAVLIAGGGVAVAENQFGPGLPSVGRDTLEGGNGNDIISGDALAASGGVAVVDHVGAFVTPPAGDSIEGGAGDDSIAGDALAMDGTAGVATGGSDTIDGGDGDDLISGDALVIGVGTVLVSSLGGYDSISGGAGDDLIYGDANLMGADLTGGNDTLHGDEGDDTIWGNGGDDSMTGDEGDDTLLGGAGMDELSGGAGDDHLSGDEGDDTLDGGGGDDWMSGGLGNDSLTGGAGDDWMFGGSGADILVGGSGDDTLNGGAGDDGMVGGLGDDHYHVNQLGDLVVEAPGEGDDTITSSINFDLNSTPHVEDLILTFGAAIGVGNSLDNLIVADDVDSFLDGGVGQDTLSGAGGADLLNGGAGNDTATGAGGNDILNGGEGDDYLHGGSGNDVVTGGAGNDGVHGGEGDDALAGGEGDDYVRGQEGDDALEGGAGNDTLIGDGGNDALLGGAGEDVFLYYSSAIGGADVIFDFETGPGGDVLRLHNLLEDVANPSDAGELATYLDFSNVGQTLTIDIDGVPGGDSLEINLVGYINFGSDEQIIQDLLDGGNLEVTS